MKSVTQIARRFGIQYSRRSANVTYEWDGRTLALRVGGSQHGPIERRSSSHVVHDIAHWLIAPPERRSIPDFGLGPVGDGASALSLPAVVTRSVALEEESMASILGIALELEAGLNWTATHENHNWPDISIASRQRVIDQIHDLGFSRHINDEETLQAILRHNYY